MANSWLFPLNLITSKIERQGRTELREIRIVLPVWLEERKAELFDQLLMGQLSRRWRNGALVTGNRTGIGAETLWKSEDGAGI